ncbi:hypothetical protein ACLOJK_022579, partial [Asimina triloba]
RIRHFQCGRRSSPWHCCDHATVMPTSTMCLGRIAGMPQVVQRAVMAVVSTERAARWRSGHWSGRRRQPVEGGGEWQQRCRRRYQSKGGAMGPTDDNGWPGSYDPGICGCLCGCAVQRAQASAAARRQVRRHHWLQAEVKTSAVDTVQVV